MSLSNTVRVCLRDVAVHQKGFAFKSTEYRPVGHAVIRVSDFTDRSIDMGSCNHIASEEAAKYTPFSLVQDDVVIATVGSWPNNPNSIVGKVVSVPKEANGALLNQNAVRLRSNGHIDQRFLFYLMKDGGFQSYIIGKAQGSASQASITLADIYDYSFVLPPLSEQRAIAHILGTLDDKIELNRRMNETLEALARAIFKSWFVDFDPVRRNMARNHGRGEASPANPGERRPQGDASPLQRGLHTPDALADIDALSPDSFEDSDLGKIPQGWQWMPLDEIAEFLNGLAMQKYPPSGDHYLPVIKIAELHRGNTDGSDKASVAIDRRYVVDDGDVLFSWSGSLEVCIWCGGKGALNQHLFKVNSREYPKWFYYFWIAHHLDSFRSIASDKATTMGHIQRHHLHTAIVAVPPKLFLEMVDRCISPLISLIVSNNIESRNLNCIRDILLPKLLSGEIRAGEGDYFIKVN